MARLRKPPPPDRDGLPVELLDPTADVWHNREQYLAYIAAKQWDLPPSERLDVPTHPENRRRDALGEWAVENGITSGPFPDWNRLAGAFRTDESRERTVL